MSQRILLSFLFCLTLTGSGCFSSKWAMRDPDYASKYDKPYPSRKPEKWRRMGKQMIDARHVEQKGGAYAKGAYSQNPDSGLLELGLYHYGKPWMSLHGGLSVLLGENQIVGFPGLDGGVRFQTPSRFAPFVGAGVYADLSPVVFNNSSNNDQQGLLSPTGPTTTQTRNSFAAVYPEAGFHYWLTSGLRMTGSAGYYFSSGGRDQDFLMVGLTFAHMSQPGPEDCAAAMQPDDLKLFNDLENAALDEAISAELPPYREASFREMFSDFAPPQDDSIKINVE